MFKSFPICFIIYISLKSNFPFSYSIHLIAKYLNYIPWINKIVDKFITLVTNNKLKTDEFIKKGF